MSLVAPVSDGKIVTTTSNTTQNTSSGMDKESFLQLLVAQMKYQDPLEPTSNTEYISQYAQFSQVESIQNMSTNMDLQRASSLVGKEVYVQTTTSDGGTSLIRGKVDYVSFENNKAYVFINETAYPLESVQSIVDSEYSEAYDLATELLIGINKLPALENVDLADADAIDELKKIYDNMTDYQKTFVASEKANLLNAYAEKIAQLRKDKEE
ncbi:MAG: flagellar hook assembly protein FlgD [Lachnospiraceae bacterium]